MKKCRITVVRRTEYPDLMARYENPLEQACGLEIGASSLPTAGKSPTDSVRAPGIPSPRSSWRSATAERIFTAGG